MDLLCGGCGRTLKADDAGAGKTIPCPHCGHGIAVPSLAELTARQEGVLTPLGQDEDLADDFLTKAKLALKKKMLVRCGSCSERLTVEQRLAGKVARCPACGHSLRIPAEAAEPTVLPALPAEDVLAEAEAPLPGLDLVELGDQRPPPPGAPHLPPPEEPAAGASAPEPVDAALAEAARAHRRRWRVRRRQHLPLGLVVLAAMLAGVACVGGWYLLLGPGRAGPDADGLAQQPSGGSPNPRAEPAPAPLPGPPPAGSGPAPATGQRPDAPPARAGVSLVSASLRVLGGEGLVPAPLGKAFLEARLRLTAGEQPLRLDPGAGGLVLQTDRGPLPPLGLAAGGGAPLAAVLAPITVAPGQTRDSAVVFLVPENLPGGTLKLAGLGEWALPTLANSPAPPAPALAGEYIEAGRYLKLAFDDPFLDRLRLAGRGSLTITPAGDDRFALSLSPPGYRGQARPLTEATFMTVLTDGARPAFPCQIRLVEGGRKLILYLADQPFHQIIYDKQ